ncbi:hypothetical protein Taro_024740 [Colocasia esculenta]|uniref:TF-B3 domain-containing protein n=1 Tax=Colocasia esculenta TaxID=4460 RepID=A0A843V735_COLES|nr:hypothetical protein [Colocasia esculenta]
MGRACAVEPTNAAGAVSTVVETIPQRLTKCFIEENLRLVTLLSPLGKSWNVRIGGDNKDLHFAEGWERFAAAHRLSIGDLLVFKYVGAVVFLVTIFDKSTCEKDYKITNGVAGDDVPGRGENCDQESECLKGNSTPPSSGQRTPPVMEQESNKHQAQVSARKEVQKSVYKAREATKQGCNKRGSCFEITVSPKLKYAVRIPVKFIRSNDLSNIHQILLKDPEGRPWPVNLFRKQSQFGYNYFSAGWRDFCSGNKLKDGDVCVFELKKKNEMLVQIHRSCGDGSRSKNPLQQAVQLKRAETLQQKRSPSIDTRTSKPTNPTQFRTTIVPTNLKHGNMNIPSAFLSLVDLSTVKEVVLVDSNSRRWPVKIYHDRKRGKCRMIGGWLGFCKKNDVEVGDTCVFSYKYIKRQATFQVEVFKSKTTSEKL